MSLSLSVIVTTPVLVSIRVLCQVCSVKDMDGEGGLNFDVIFKQVLKFCVPIRVRERTIRNHSICDLTQVLTFTDTGRCS